MRRIALYLILACLWPCASAQPQPWIQEHLKHGVPRVSTQTLQYCTPIVREGYVALHDNRRQIPLWVAYRLDPADLKENIERTDDFREDPVLPSERGELDDYQGSGYDRGHMAPAADMRKSRTVQSQSFFLSNIAPQDPALNRGAWRSLESQIRDWLPSKRQLWVYTGPGYTDFENYDTIGDGVAVAPFFWKIIVDEKPDGTVSAVGFLLPNRRAGDLRQYARTVDFIEQGTTIDFLPALPDEIEDQVESSVTASDWPLTGGGSSSAARSGGSSSQREFAGYAQRQQGKVYIAPNHGERFHKFDCSSLANATATRAVTRAQARAAGYTACGRCKP